MGIDFLPFMQLTTPFGPEALTPYEFIGYEKINQPFFYEISAMGHVNQFLDPKIILGKAISLILNADQSNPRYFHGNVIKFLMNDFDNGIAFYKLHVYPSLYLLNFINDCHVFCNIKSSDIIKNLLEKENISYVLEGDQDLPIRNQCSQYNETSLHFIQRLMEEDGLLYLFEQNQSQPKMMIHKEIKLISASRQTHELPFIQGSSDRYRITKIQQIHSLYAGKHHVTDYNFENPRKILSSTTSIKPQLEIANKYKNIHHPGNYIESKDGINRANLQMSAEEAEAFGAITGESNFPNLRVADRLKILQSFSQDDQNTYHIIGIKHHAYDDKHLGNNGQGTQRYDMQFNAVPTTLNYTAPKTTIKPLIRGNQTATVVGENEISTDEHGRIKVHFHWHENASILTSTWLRMSHPLAGKNWGVSFLPRKGQEVLISFEHGDPDRPYILGGLHNAIQKTTFNFPSEKTKTGIRTKTLGQDGMHNELSFDDNTGHEKIYMHAQKDLEQVVQHNKNLSIMKGNHHIQVQNGSSTIQAAQNIQMQVGENSIQLTNNGVEIKGTNVSINK